MVIALVVYCTDEAMYACTVNKQLLRYCCVFNPVKKISYPKSKKISRYPKNIKKSAKVIKYLKAETRVQLIKSYYVTVVFLAQ